MSGMMNDPWIGYGAEGGCKAAGRGTEAIKMIERRGNIDELSN